MAALPRLGPAAEFRDGADRCAAAMPAVLSELPLRNRTFRQHRVVETDCAVDVQEILAGLGRPQDRWFHTLARVEARSGVSGFVVEFGKFSVAGRPPVLPRSMPREDDWSPPAAPGV